MKTIQVTIKGISPLLMNRFPMEPIAGLDKKPAEEQAQIALYEIDGRPYIPGVNIQRALIAGSAYSKGKGRASLQKVVSAALFIDTMLCDLGEGTSKWVVDARSVVIPATKGRIVRYRPRFDEWNTEFQLSFDETLLSETQVRTVVDDTGARVGLLDFRPERKGPFGRFSVIGWEI